MRGGPTKTTQPAVPRMSTKKPFYYDGRRTVKKKRVPLGKNYFKRGEESRRGGQPEGKASPKWKNSLLSKTEDLALERSSFVWKERNRKREIEGGETKEGGPVKSKGPGEK